MQIKEAISRARYMGLALPAFNIPYLPMMEPVCSAIYDLNAVAMVQVARLEWEKFEAKSLARVAAEYIKFAHPGHTFLHLDHVPVIDEDGEHVDYIPLLKEAARAGYQSLMIDGSRLSLSKNIRATHEAAQLAHSFGLPLEAELGAVLGHEAQALPPYEEIFASKRGFTKVDEASIFARESGCDWLSIAAGNIHGAIQEATRHQKKPAARLDVSHIQLLYEATNLPLVLHGGSGISLDYLSAAILAGIAKINVGTEIRQAYENTLSQTSSLLQAQDAVYRRTYAILDERFGLRDGKAQLESLTQEK